MAVSNVRFGSIFLVSAHPLGQQQVDAVTRGWVQENQGEVNQHNYASVNFRPAGAKMIDHYNDGLKTIAELDNDFGIYATGRRDVAYLHHAVKEFKNNKVGLIQKILKRQGDIHFEAKDITPQFLDKLHNQHEAIWGVLKNGAKAMVWGIAGVVGSFMFGSFAIALAAIPVTIYALKTFAALLQSKSIKPDSEPKQQPEQAAESKA